MKIIVTYLLVALSCCFTPAISISISCSKQCQQNLNPRGDHSCLLMALINNLLPTTDVLAEFVCAYDKFKDVEDKSELTKAIQKIETVTGCAVNDLLGSEASLDDLPKDLGGLIRTALDLLSGLDIESMSTPMCGLLNPLLLKVSGSLVDAPGGSKQDEFKENTLREHGNKRPTRDLLSGLLGSNGGLLGGVGGVTNLLPRLTGILPGVTGLLPGVTGLLPGVTGLLPGVTGLLPGLLGGVTGLIPGLIGGVSGITGLAPQLFGGLTGANGGQEVLGGVGSVTNLLGGLTGGISGGCGRQTNDLVGDLVRGLTSNIGGLTHSLGRVTGGVGNLVDGLGSLAGGVGSLTGGLGSLTGGLGSLAGGVGKITNGVGGLTQSLPGVTGGLGSLLSGFTGLHGGLSAGGSVGGGLNLLGL